MEHELSLLLSQQQATALYALLRGQSDLNGSLVSLHRKLEAFIYPLLSLEELENLDKLVGKE